MQCILDIIWLNMHTLFLKLFAMYLFRVESVWCNHAVSEMRVKTLDCAVHNVAVVNRSVSDDGLVISQLWFWKLSEKSNLLLDNSLCRVTRRTSSHHFSNFSYSVNGFLQEDSGVLKVTCLMQMLLSVHTLDTNRRAYASVLSYGWTMLPGFPSPLKDLL